MVEKVILTMLSLVALYLIIANAGQFDSILKGLSQFNVATLGILQGRNANVGGVSVTGPTQINQGGNDFGGVGSYPRVTF